MTSVHLSLGLSRLLWALLAAGMLVLMALPGQAQSQARQGGDVFERPSHEHENELPDWARPSESSGIDEETGTADSPSQGQFSLEDQMQTKAPGGGGGDPGGDGDPVPVDGGVALLAAAGAGYAVRKLNEGEDDDDEPA